MSSFEQREREKARELRQSQWWKNIKAQGICHYCGQKFAPELITMDHVVPVSSGGHSSKDNVVPACKKCNTDKKDVNPMEELFAQIKREKEKKEPE